jgi:outer membrane protein TolC
MLKYFVHFNSADLCLNTMIKMNSATKCTMLVCTLLASPFCTAQSMSFQQAEIDLLNNSYSNQANLALQQASQLEAEAIKGIGLPRVDLNVRAYAFHNELDVPLGAVKNNLEQSLTNGLNAKIDEFNLGAIADPLKESLKQPIHDGVGLIPDSSQVVLDDQVIRPSVSVMMPLYTGGLTQSAKDVAKIKAQRSELTTQQQQDTQRFELIQAYFNAQLQKQLLASSQSNLSAMQLHYQNALKLERQGFISKGQRMQFEVAQNNATRSVNNSQAQYQASLFKLNNLLHHSQINDLTTPLFINTQPQRALQQWLDSFANESTLIQKMQMDTALANANVKVQQASKKPNVFAFGEYSLDSNQNWIVGVGAKYNLFSGIDKNKNVQAAELQRYASELLTARTKQEIENTIFSAFSEAQTAQQSDVLLQQNIKAAQENLRIQQLSFKEDMGTATQVIDAQNTLNGLKAETALNAFKYVMSLATLLQSHGSIQQFQSFINQPNTHYIR